MLRNRVYAGMKYVCTSVHLSRNVRLCTANKRLDSEAPILAHSCTLTMYVCLPIFIQNLNVLDVYFQGQIFESSTLGSSYVIISQTVTDRANITIANT